ncbi:MAG: ribonuclease H-like domain-containing protein [Patescibacteria group bacterium]
MDKLVLDIETSNTFAEVGGRDRLEELNVSLIGAYSYDENRYLAFHEHDIAAFEPYLKRAGLIIGFAVNRFDIPVLKKHFSLNLSAIPRLDLLDEIELVRGGRVSLNILAKANLGIEKTHDGLDAPRLYREGNFKELEAYCLNDVKITKNLYELVKRQGHLLIPDRMTGELVKTELDLREAELPATLF